jgi:hypothetical protein
MAESIKQLRQLTDDEIIARHDKHAQSTSVGTNHYLTGLARRDQEKHDQVMLDLTEKMLEYTETVVKFTKWIVVMTMIMLICTIINVLAMVL